MKHGQISQQQLLEQAKAIVAAEGAGALSICRLAQECGIAVGSVYNYFTAKSDLLAAVISEFCMEKYLPKVHKESLIALAGAG